VRGVVRLGCLASALGPCLMAQGSFGGRVTLDAEPVPGAVVYLAPSGPVVTAPVASTVIDQRSLRFRPALAVVTPGSVVAFLNSDSLLHNVFSPGGPDGPFDLGTYTTGERRERTFGGVGTHVILCHVHPEMVAYGVIVPTPWYAVADSNRLAKSSSPRELNRWKSAAARTGVGVELSMAAATVQRPSPESDTLPANGFRSWCSASARAVKSSSHDPTRGHRSSKPWMVCGGESAQDVPTEPAAPHTGVRGGRLRR